VKSTREKHDKNQLNKKIEKNTPKNTEENRKKNWHGFCKSSGLANTAKFQTKKK